MKNLSGLSFGARACLAPLAASILAISPWCAARADDPGAAGKQVSSDKVAVTADQALQRLLEGNRRYVEGVASHPGQSVVRRKQLASGQAPFAIVLTCSDSRVAPELYFDQGLGDLFVVRNAGNILDDHVLGSIEYAVSHLHSPVIIVVGHEKCGAVAAAVAGGRAPGHIQSIVEAIAPSVEKSKNDPGDKLDNAIRANAQRMAESLGQTAPIINAAVAAGQVKVVPAEYSLETGKVNLLK